MARTPKVAAVLHSPAASKMRAYRVRLRAGRIVVRSEVDECEFVSCLVADQLLDPTIADDRRAIDAALGELLTRYMRGERRYR